MFYVYGHYKPNEERPFYVGKGTGRRCFSRSGRPKHWHHIVNKYFSETGLPIIKILSGELESEELAFDLEKFWIALFGRINIKTGCLINLTNGGEGISGFTYSKRQKQLISRRQKRFFSNRDKRLSAIEQGFLGCWMWHPEYGHEFCVNQTDFCRIRKLNLGHLNDVILGRRRHHKGWQVVVDGQTLGKSLEELKKIRRQNQQVGKKKYFDNISSDISIKLSRAQGFEGVYLVHVEHGKRFCNNMAEFSRMWNLERSTLSQLINKKQGIKQHRGWRLECQ